MEKTMQFKKYRQYPVVKNITRKWTNNQINEAPIYCSVDLRDGNQALVNPLTIEQKIAYFNCLVKMGFKHIEVSYPSASDTDFYFTRKLIEENLVPDDVFIQVLIPAKKEWIKKSVEAMRGVKNGIFHLYNPTNEFQRRVVFNKSDEEIIAMAVEGIKYLKELTQEFEGNIVYEYTPESFSQTNLEFALKICNEVIKTVKPTIEKKMIINLPNTLEACMPNIYADRIEWMCNHLHNKDALIVSVHPHNDRGTAVASAELAVLAGANRVEGTLFGNGERAGNLDLITFAFNIYSQGINPKLNLSFIDEVKEFFEEITQIKTHIRHPYVGEMIFTAFSGGHQDAIKKGMDFYRSENCEEWNVPYLPIDPKDINRDYEKIIRINSQSGKGGVRFIISEFFGEELSNNQAIELGNIIKEETDKLKRELSKEEIIKLYKKSKKKRV
jgi:2-isopropylmalate synthase